MKFDIKIYSKHFTEIEIKELPSVILEIIKQYCTNLNLSSLEGMVITDQFESSIEEYQIEHGLKSIKPTNNEYGEAIGKVLRRKVDGEFRYTVFLNSLIVKGLSIEESKQFCKHYIHHEFCHVHDDTVKESMFTESGIRGDGIHMLTHMMNVLSDTVWAEYIVSRLCSPSLSDLNTIKEHIGYLLDHVKENAKKDIYAYRSHADIQQLYYQVETGISYLLKMLSTFLGYIHGISESRPDLDNDFDEIIAMINNSYVSEYWDELGAVLDNLYAKYYKWNDVHELNSLGEVAIKLFGELGLHLEYLEDSFYVNVP